MSNVKLAIRVRPFTDRELQSGETQVVKVINDTTVSITNVKVSTSGAGDSRERERIYDADYTFDSCCAPTHCNYASQEKVRGCNVFSKSQWNRFPYQRQQDVERTEKVYNTIGPDVLSCWAGGKSACVLAYGQSSTGKTHTMLGTDTEPGLVPRLCHYLAVEQSPLTVSFLEIYNERVHDLLAGEEVPVCASLPRRRGNRRKDLRVREDPVRGTFVQNLRRVVVADVEALLLLVSEGARRRRTAATRRNPNSSRSHALLEISSSKATLHFADLAGSEKASFEPCGKGRQKEGSSINKSLVALSNVISALVNAVRGRCRFIPYRDSALTWLLKECFTGGASTFIIATVSPTSSCYGETASTLRWAARARQLPDRRLARPARGVSIAVLQAQLDHLIAELAKDFIFYRLDTRKLIYDQNHWKMENTKRSFDKQVANNDEKTSSPAILKAKILETGPVLYNLNSDKTNKEKYKSNLSQVISKEMDRLFGPSLARTRSGSDIKITPPVRVKRRQYRSQEIIPMDKTFSVLNPNVSSSNKLSKTDTPVNNNSDVIDKPTNSSQVSISYDNEQRAEIVASVTERLYSKLKKKEDSTMDKIETAFDKKVIEPLNELRICTNARSKLMELSQRALRHKRKIGIPVYTQTKIQVIRLKDQEIDVQTDLLPYLIKETNKNVTSQDVATETMSFAPRYKDIATGPKYGIQNCENKSTVTDVNQLSLKDSLMMTENIPKSDEETQTILLPPPRKKRANMTKYLRPSFRKNNIIRSASPIININISQTYPTDAEEPIPSTSNDVHTDISNSTIPPDLIKHHSTELTPKGSLSVSDEDVENHSNNSVFSEKNRDSDCQCNGNLSATLNNAAEFPENDLSLPRLKINSMHKSNPQDIKNIILGRNKDVYPYNIVFSPPREIEAKKRSVKFKNEKCNSEQNSTKDITEKDIRISDSYDPPCDSSESLMESKSESDYFIWKKTSVAKDTRIYNQPKPHTIYRRQNHNSKNVRTQMYRDFLRLNSKHDSSDTLEINSSSDYSNNSDFQGIFEQKRNFFEKKVNNESKHNMNLEYLENKLLKSCDVLEKNINKYESHLTTYHQNCHQFCNSRFSRSPKEYLQHLVQIRKEVVENSFDKSYTSTDNS